MRTLLFASCLASLLSAVPSAAWEAPRGVFSASGATNPVVLAHPEVHGVLIRAGWADLEPQPGIYNFTALQVQSTAARMAGKQWSMAVSGSDHPAWLREQFGADSFTITFRGAPKIIPKAWDPVVRERLALLVAALGDAFGDDPALALVYVPQMSANGIEGHFNGVTAQQLAAAGYTEDRWVESVAWTAHLVADAFPAVPVAVEVHEIAGSVEPARRILTELWADSSLEGRVGGACWWLSGRTDYQPALLDFLATYDGLLLCQLIAPSSEPERFLDGHLGTALEQAQALGSRYVEAWEYEFTSHASDGLLADFNAATSGATAVASDEASAASGLRAFPNPCRSRTILYLELPAAGEVVCEVFDLAGHRVRSLRLGEAGPGPLHVEWDGRDDAARPVGGGTYLARARAGAWRATTTLRLTR